METKSQTLIRQIKDIKKQKKISYNDIMLAMPKVNGVSPVSLSTVRRVFAAGSETSASSFNYESTLVPVAEAVKHIANSSAEARCAEEIKECLAEISRNFEKHIEFMTAQIDGKDALIHRLINRLDQKDDIIHQLITDMRQKDEIIRKMSI